MVRLTQYSHGAGCGCKIAPDVLGRILAGQTVAPDAALWVGNHDRDDAAVLDLGDGRGLISTTDFFMPVVDDPFVFGQIAATNAISDVYAMGGTPTLAIAILGWPLDKLPAEVAGEVVRGGRKACSDAGIPLAGGHSIDSPEPIFGLAVNGLVEKAHLKRNSGARPGDVVYLTKPLGIGVLTTAEKKGLLTPDLVGVAAHWMVQLNRVGAALGRLPGVTALTDVTGFGLLGHGVEMAEGSGATLQIDAARVRLLPGALRCLRAGAVPGGTRRNLAAYGHRVRVDDAETRDLFADPQTSGGLLVACDPAQRLDEVFRAAGLADALTPIGVFLPAGDVPVVVTGAVNPA